MRLLTLGLALVALAFFSQNLVMFLQTSLGPDQIQIPEILRMPVSIAHYNPPTIKSVDAYTILFVGDSMTAALGENFDELRKMLSAYFPNKTFGLFNYSLGSTNLLSVEERLTRETKVGARTEPPILDREFEVIILESFGYNPLSHLPLEEGLRKQTETLDKLVAELVYRKHGSLIVFLATIAPSRANYGRNTVELTDEERTSWANERIAYINNHIKYAGDHNIPLINVFEKSRNAEGDGDLRYINSSDYIHPSTEGVVFISQLIADYLNGVLPH